MNLNVSSLCTTTRSHYVLDRERERVDDSAARRTLSGSLDDVRDFFISYIKNTFSCDLSRDEFQPRFEVRSLSAFETKETREIGDNKN